MPGTCEKDFGREIRLQAELPCYHAILGCDNKSTIFKSREINIIQHLGILCAQIPPEVQLCAAHSNSLSRAFLPTVHLYRLPSSFAPGTWPLLWGSPAQVAVLPPSASF